jgi:patatin-like phospholipase/acyl hydrolase
MGALFSNEGLRGFLGQEQLLGEKTLADLKKKVMVTSFHLDGINKITGGRTWKPKVFHNTVQGDPDMREKAVDIALRTGAAPVFYPIVDGFVDGGLFANNPAMVALAQVAHLNRVRMMAADLPEARQQPQLHEVVLLSLGVGEDKAYVDVQSANWGYFPWVFNPLSPFILINALLQGDVMGVDFEAAQMMPADNYFRLNPYYARNSPIPGAVDTRQIKATVASQATQSSIDDVCQWLDKTGWMD